MTFNAGSKLRASQINDGPFVTPIGGQRRTTNTGPTSGTTELQVLTTGALALEANSTYRIRFQCRVSSGTSGDSFIARVRDTSTAGTERAGAIVFVNSAGHGGNSAEAIHVTSAAENHTFIGSIQRETGTGTCIVVQPGSQLICERIGADDLLTTA